MTEEEKKAIEAQKEAETIAAQQKEQENLHVAEDLEAKNTALEAEKARLIEEAANYKMAYLKEKKKKEDFGDDDEESSDEKMRRIARETLADSRLAEIASEQDAIIKKALKENKELKLANMNKPATVSAGMGSSSEGPKVQDTLVTPEQLSAFKARGWSDKDIERYKKNLQKFGGR